jgi:DNA-directed RNA polymerase specialized sigma24 family protein
VVIRDILERSIDELPDELRSVFVACVVDGMTPEQFAELFALTSETVGTSAQRPKCAG